jgi:hypothetical protein
MNQIQDTQNLRVLPGTNPVAVTRAFAKARMGDRESLRWLMGQHQAGNVAASRALQDLARCEELLQQEASVA